jgi:hypothetical protein
MSEEDIINLKHDVERHETDLDFQPKQIQELREDLEVIAAFGNQNFLIGQIRHYTEGVPSAKPALKEKCLRFLKRYGSVETP